MDLKTFIAQNAKPLIYIASIIYTGVRLVRDFNKRKELTAKKQRISKQKVINFKQAQQKLILSRKQSDENTYLIKAFPKLSNGHMQFQKKLHFNQLMLREPSLNKIVVQIVSNLNKCHSSIDKSLFEKQVKKLGYKQHILWKIGQNPGMAGYTIPVTGYGQILDHQIFKVAYEFKKNEKKGMFQSLRQSIAYFFQLVFFFNLRHEGRQRIQSISQDINRAPFIMGPVVGLIRYFISFFFDRPLLIEAKFQAGKLLPLTVSSSKNNLLSHIDELISSKNYSMVQSFVLVYFLYRFLSPHLRKLGKDFINVSKNMFSSDKLRKKNQQVFRIMGSSRIDQNSICIICYTNCRNTILFNCKHLIMCDECYQTVHQKHCPLCKTEIVEQKILGKV